MLSGCAAAISGVQPHRQEARDHRGPHPLFVELACSSRRAVERALVRPSFIRRWLIAVITFENRGIPDQDTLVSILSKQLMITLARRVSARPGFNVIATANLRDRGVHEMSAALKRRFNFETVRPIADRAFEAELIAQALATELGPERPALPESVLSVLVTAFSDLRTGVTTNGSPVKRPDAVMSTAEAVNVAVAASMSARYFGDNTVSSADIARQLVGVALKGEAEDASRMRHYVDSVVRERARSSAEWKEFFRAAEGCEGEHRPAGGPDSAGGRHTSRGG